MNINSVTSFKGTDFNSLIAEPPASSLNPIAANPLEPDSYEKQGSSTGKKIAKTIVGLGVIAATLGILRGKFLKDVELTKGFSGQTGFWGKTKFVIAKAGEFVNEYASKAWNKVKSIFGKGEKAAEKAADDASKAAETATGTAAETAAK